MKNKLFLAALVLTLTAASAGVAHAAFTLKDWQFSRRITVPANNGFAKIVLPSDVSKSANGFADIRVVNQDNQETAYNITRNMSRRGGSMHARVLNLGTTGKSPDSPTAKTQFVADLGQNGLIHSGVILDIASKNFRRQVSIYSSHFPLTLDNDNWSLITDKAYVFRFTDPTTGFTSGKTQIDFSPSSAQYFKIVIGGGDEGAVDVQGATFYGDVVVDTPSYTKTLTPTVENNPTRKTTEITLDLGSVGNLTNAITLRPNSSNYSRRVVIEASNGDAAGNEGGGVSSSTVWSYVSEGSISNISTSLFQGSSNRIEYPEQKTRYIRASIVNDDNRPLTISDSVSVEGPIVSIVFETHPGETYTLYYGNPRAKTPVYDIGRIAAYIEENKVPSAYLSEEIENQDYVAPPAQKIPFTEAHKNLLNSFLLIVVVILALGIGWYMRLNFKKRK